MLTLFIAVAYSFSNESIYCVLNRLPPSFSDSSVHDPQHAKLNTKFSWIKRHSTRRLFSQANLT